PAREPGRDRLAERILGTELYTVNLTAAGVDRLRHVRGRAVHGRRNILRLDEALHLLVERADAHETAAREIILVGQVELPGTIGIELRITRGTAAKIKAVGAAREAIGIAQPQGEQVLRCNDFGPAEADLL